MKLVLLSYIVLIIVTVLLKYRKNLLKVKDKEYQILDKIQLIQHFGKNHVIQLDIIEI
jgi:hypothetical protein